MAVLQSYIMLRKIYKFFVLKSEKKLSFKLNDILEKLDFKNITLIDVGAAGDIIPRWKRIEKYLTYHGFEPDKRSRDKLLKKGNNCKSYIIHDKIVSNKLSEKKIYLCKDPQNSSTYKPNKLVYKFFPFPERFEIKKEIFIKTTTLDNINLASSDFIKLDIQGGELEALKGSEKTLRKTLGLEVEVEFVEIYKNQPLFDKIFKFLESKEFVFIDFPRIVRWERDNLYSSLGQMTWADALFLRTPEYIVEKYNDETVLKKYIVICIIYNKFDFVKQVCEHIKIEPIILKKISKLRKDLYKRHVLKKQFNYLLEMFNFRGEEIHNVH